MAQDGTLAEIINQQVFQELNTAIQNNTNNINSIENEIKTYPFYDILKNGGHADGITPNDNIIINAKNNGYRKFYFPQNSTNDANYYFNDTPNINNCEILNDNNVILNFPDSGGIDNTKNAIFNSNINVYSRQNNLVFSIPKNTPDFFNNLIIPKDYTYSKSRNYLLSSNETKLFKYDIFGSNLFVDDTENKNTKFKEVDIMNVNLKTENDYYGLLCAPIEEDGDCIEVVTNGNLTQLYFGILRSSDGKGVLGKYTGNDIGYWYANGDPNPQYQNGILFNFLNNHSHDTINNDWHYPVKYKLRYSKEKGGIDVFINDIYAGFLYDGAENPSHFGFGFLNSNVSQTNQFSRIIKYNQKNIPFNTNLNILIAGDSRCYGYNENYRIEKILENGLLYNGVNKVNINNISVSGWTIQDISNAIHNENLSNYDIVVIATGINNYGDSFGNISTAINKLVEYIHSQNCMVVVPATMPTSPYTDLASRIRTEQYYKIQCAISLGVSSITNNKLFARYVDNVCGMTSNANNLPISSDGVHPNNVGMIEFVKSIMNGIFDLFSL